jgi:hypothetical protein
LFETKHYVTIKPADAWKIRVLCPGRGNWMGNGMNISLYGVTRSTANSTANRTGQPEWIARLAIHPRDTVPQKSDVINVKIGSTFAVKNQQWEVIDIKRVDRVVLNEQKDCQGRFVQIKRSS